MIPADNYQSLGELLRDALVQYKSSTALIEANRKREHARWSYLEFWREARPLARWLAARGVEGGSRVAIIMSNQARWLMSAYAIFYRGGVLVPLDYKLTAPEQDALLQHCAPRVLITEYAMWKRFEPKPGIEHVVVVDAPARADLGHAVRWESLVEEAGGDEEVALIPRRREDVASIVYSSGTGGRAKGCMLTHDSYLVQYDALSRFFEMGPGDRYFSILPTNHAIDFMAGFIAPFACGATVVHQRSLRPEFIMHAMKRYEITHMAVVPLLLAAFERRIREQLDALPGFVRAPLQALAGINETFTRRRPNLGLSRRLLAPIHSAFGGHLKVLFCGGAFVEKERAEFFYRLGLPVAIGYGLTECCTVATLNDLKPFRGDSVGRPVPGVEVRVADPDAHGIGEVLIRGRTLMKGYLDDPELTAETIVDGWLHTGDLGYLDASQHLHLVGRARNMIVTEGGKNIYPEDIEAAFEGLECEELAVFAANYIWPQARLEGEELIVVVRHRDRMVARSEREVTFFSALRKRNRRLADFKRVHGVLDWPEAFPRTASMKLKRQDLAAQLRAALGRDAVEPI